MRDRLINLIEDFCRDKYVEKYIPTQEAYDFFIAATAFADYLLANGVIVPPCKVGGKVYIISRNKVKECEVVFIGLSAAENWSHFNFIETYANGTFYKTHSVHFSEIGKTVFLTREEAEQSLKGDKDINVLCKTEKGGEGK